MAASKYLPIDRCLQRVPDRLGYRYGRCTLPIGHEGDHGDISWASMPTEAHLGQKRGQLLHVLERDGRKLEVYAEQAERFLLVQDDDPLGHSIVLTLTELRWLVLSGGPMMLQTTRHPMEPEPREREVIPPGGVHNAAKPTQ